MRCGYVQRHIVVFLENQMPPDVAEKIKSHLSWCKHCSDVAKQVEEVRQPVKDSMGVDIEPPPGMVQSVMARIENMDQAAPAPPDRRYAFIAVLAIIVLFLAIFVVPKILKLY